MAESLYKCVLHGFLEVTFQTSQHEIISHRMGNLINSGSVCGGKIT